MQEIAAPPRVEPFRTTVRRRTGPRLVLACLTVGIVAVGTFVLTSVRGGPEGHGPAAFAVTPLPDGVVSIRVVDSDVSAKAMTAQLQAKGIHVGITALPVSPQLVGTWVGSGGDGDVPEGLSRSVAEQTHGYVATIEIPASFPGNLALAVGRAPRAGEAIMVDGARNALAPGGILACDGLRGAEPARAEAVLVAQGYTVNWSKGVASPVLQAPPAGTRVTEAIVDDDAPTVRLVVASPTDKRSFDAQQWRGFAPSQRSDAAATAMCTG